MIDYHDLARLAGDRGLELRGGFHPTSADEVPCCPDGSATTTLVLLGFVGKLCWPEFAASDEAKDGEADPLDRWSRRIIDELARSTAAGALYPFPTDRPPYMPFQRWAQRAEPVYVSPVKILLHPDWGLWHSYRGALTFPDRMTLPARDTRLSPCDSCETKPCLSGCPVDAFAAGGYAVARCVAHIASPRGLDCMRMGCRARRACPVGAEHTYTHDEAAFHMQAFLSRRRATDATAQDRSRQDAGIKGIE
jgi:hypothetical protein